MATIIWNNDEKIAVVENGEIEFADEQTAEIDEKNLDVELSRLGVEYDATQSGIKREYAWQVDQDGIID